MNAKISVFLICVEAIIYLLLYNLHDCTFKDTQFTHVSTRMAAWLLLTFFICLPNQLSSIHSIKRITEYRCLKIVIHQIDSKNEWLHLSASSTAKFWVGFCLNTGNCLFS